MMGCLAVPSRAMSGIGRGRPAFRSVGRDRSVTRRILVITLDLEPRFVPQYRFPPKLHAPCILVDCELPTTS